MSSKIGLIAQSDAPWNSLHHFQSIRQSKDFIKATRFGFAQYAKYCNVLSTNILKTNNCYGWNFTAMFDTLLEIISWVCWDRIQIEIWEEKKCNDSLI